MPESLTPEERAAKISRDLELDEVVADYQIDGECARSLIAAAIREAVAARDMEWWQALACVDNVAPTPEAVKEWVAVMHQHFEEEAVAAEREACAKIAESLDTPYAQVYEACDYPDALREGIAAAIRARGATP